MQETASESEKDVLSRQELHAARCLASSALRRQASLSDDVRGGFSNAPNQAASAALVSWS